jgi:hypothetical protein
VGRVLGLPEISYGIWSAPDTYDSVISKHPGQTMFTEHTANDKKVQGELELNWTDFPVMNMHPHAWPLYSSVKLLGLEFHEGGVSNRNFPWRNMRSALLSWDIRNPRSVSVDGMHRLQRAVGRSS